MVRTAIHAFACIFLLRLAFRALSVYSIFRSFRLCLAAKSALLLGKNKRATIRFCLSFDWSIKTMASKQTENGKLTKCIELKLAAWLQWLCWPITKLEKRRNRWTLVKHHKTPFSCPTHHRNGLAAVNLVRIQLESCSFWPGARAMPVEHVRSRSFWLFFAEKMRFRRIRVHRTSAVKPTDYAIGRISVWWISEATTGFGRRHQL